MNNLDKYQKAAYRTAVYKDKSYPYFALAEEAGEVCGLAAKTIRKHGTLEHLPTQRVFEELGDVMWAIAAICTDLGIEMSDVADFNIGKLQAREEEGTLVER